MQYLERKEKESLYFYWNISEKSLKYLFLNFEINALTVKCFSVFWQNQKEVLIFLNSDGFSYSSDIVQLIFKLVSETKRNTIKIHFRLHLEIAFRDYILKIVFWDCILRLHFEITFLSIKSETFVEEKQSILKINNINLF